MAETKDQSVLATKLQKIAARSVAKPTEKFGKLMPLFNEINLTQCFQDLKEGKAAGIDNKTKEDYEQKLAENIADLVDRMKSMSYHPSPVKEVLIPKDDGGKRPLGISVVEDKIIQLMYSRVLEAIFESRFLDSSHGFRPQRNCHQAIQKIITYLFSNRTPFIIDADVKNYFGTIDHSILLGILRDFIDDERFLRYLVRMLKAGILSDGKFTKTDEGSPQGAICSPVLSNIYAHFALDLWIERDVKGAYPRVELVRYADDFVICCPNELAARSIFAVLGKRLNKYNLQLHETKTKLVKMNKYEFSAGHKQGTFSFLGFTFFLGKSQKGVVIPKLKTDRKKFRSKLKGVKVWVRGRRSSDLVDTWDRLKLKIVGHARYYGVSHNKRSVAKFIAASEFLFFKWMNRRSQKRSMSWEKFNLFKEINPGVKPLIYVPLFAGYSQRKI